VIGKREAEQGMVAVRARGAAGKKQDVISLADFIARVVKEKESRTVNA
jgi:threonyl-tRNA synthetase